MIRKDVRFYMDIKEFSEIIDRNTEDFLEYIKKTTRSGKKYKFSSTYFFPILEDEKNYLYECKHYDRFLEMTIRECLVTNVLIDLIKALDDRHVSVERIPCEDLDSEYNYGRQINKYNIEFFLCVDGIRLGVCYNDLLFDETIRGSIAFLKYAKKIILRVFWL